jgi:hypothetical protein
VGVDSIFPLTLFLENVAFLKNIISRKKKKIKSGLIFSNFKSRRIFLKLQSELIFSKLQYELVFSNLKYGLVFSK